MSLAEQYAIVWEALGPLGVLIFHALVFAAYWRPIA